MSGDPATSIYRCDAGLSASVPIANGPIDVGGLSVSQIEPFCTADVLPR